MNVGGFGSAKLPAEVFRRPQLNPDRPPPAAPVPNPATTVPKPLAQTLAKKASAFTDRRLGMTQLGTLGQGPGERGQVEQGGQRAPPPHPQIRIPRPAPARPDPPIGVTLSLWIVLCSGRLLVRP